jgi:phospholipid transport system substrate-binding protein
MKKPLWIISLTLVVFWVWVMPAQAESPTAYVRSILDKVMSLQNDASLSGQARARAIHGIIEVSFDFALMAKNSLGSTYDSLSGGQRQEFTRTFSYLFQDSYTRLVLNFLKKENIQFGAERLEGDKAQVATTIVRPNENIPVTYLMHKAPSGWLLYDVIVDGVSILHNYQTQFGQVIRTKSFDFLLDKMKEQRRAVE